MNQTLTFNHSENNLTFEDSYLRAFVRMFIKHNDPDYRSDCQDHSFHLLITLLSLFTYSCFSECTFLITSAQRSGCVLTAGVLGSGFSDLQTSRPSSFLFTLQQELD